MDILRVIISEVGTVYKFFLFYIVWDLLLPGNRNKKTIVIVIMTGMGMVIDFIPVTGSGIPFTTIIISAVAIPITFVFFREGLLSTLGAILLHWNLRSISYFFVNSLTAYPFQWMMHGIENAPDIEKFIELRTALMQIILEILNIAVCMLAYIPVKKSVKTQNTMSVPDFLYTALPAVTGVLLTFVMTRITIVVRAEDVVVLTDEKPELLWQLPLIAAFLYGAQLSAIYMWQRNIDHKRQSRLIAIQDAEREALKKRLHDTGEYYDSIKRVRHEMSGHLTNINGLAKAGEYEKLSEYIGNLASDIRTVTPAISTGSPILDVAVGDKMLAAGEAGIKVEAQIFYKDEWHLSEYDLGIIFGNILDNAIKATKEVEDDSCRLINISMREQGSVIFIRCENPYNQNQDKFVKHDDPNDWHGLGLLNVRDIAIKHGGDLKIEEKENTFLITVMLKKGDA